MVKNGCIKFDEIWCVKLCLSGTKPLQFSEKSVHVQMRNCSLFIFFFSLNVAECRNTFITSCLSLLFGRDSKTSLDFGKRCYGPFKKLGWHLLSHHYSSPQIQNGRHLLLESFSWVSQKPISRFLWKLVDSFVSIEEWIPLIFRKWHSRTNALCGFLEIAFFWSIIPKWLIRFLCISVVLPVSIRYYSRLNFRQFRSRTNA